MYKGLNIKTLLVADDEKHIRILYKEILEKKGYKVLLAENGQQTLSMIEKEQIDLVILDMRMPDVNGVEVLRKLGTKKSHPPVLINSAYSGYMEDPHCWGAEDYIIKSSDLTELLKKIKEILKEGKANGQLVGGNLAVLQTLLGTEFEPDWRGKILFWEEN